MQVLRIDHVHVEVPDRDVAADWFQTVLGLTRHAEFAHWAEDPMGPLILAGGDGQPTLSLFARDAGPSDRDATIAFRVTGADFIAFLDRAEGLRLHDRFDAPVSRAMAMDHGGSWSVYFVDPYGNRFEVTSYDVDIVAAALAG
ncbi:MAG: VOC family protein [Paracoccaceae bacterium]